MNCAICKVKAILCPFQIQRVLEQAAPSSPLWETSAGKSWQCVTGDLRQGRIAALPGTDLSTNVCSLWTHGTSHGRKRDLPWTHRIGRDHIQGVRNNLPRKGGWQSPQVTPQKTLPFSKSPIPIQHAGMTPAGSVPPCWQCRTIPGAAALWDAPGGGMGPHAKVWDQGSHWDRHNRNSSTRWEPNENARASPNPITADAGRNLPNPWSHSGP